ncbi:uncharacterized protein B0P05DRAFT_7135 [Gilbertella persicaria]|uniref:uncharacterized protein n=1 Tax=Gilbertella persicaria TaxID=101096 RepID=UPI00221F9E7E|nr:uncharacterized protein B0P05DRAFT_7135 [Gilbertella persicaria]KAI8098333.1 hypothetical protein B0P05DRAFT_7135 [Gilbertella persicaria]
MVRVAKKQDTPEEDRLVSKFLKEVRHIETVKTNWKAANIPEDIQVHSFYAKLKEVKQAIDEYIEGEYESYKIDLAENEKIETVRKENVFGEEVTESEMDIIQKRVALQQRQFKEFERREHARKSKKIKAVYDYLTDEEITEMLQDCKNDEEEVIVRLTQPGYLSSVRKTIATKHAPEVETSHNSMSAEQQAAYKQLLKKRSETLKKTTNESAKKQYRMGGRLGLDEALKQVQENQIDPEKAFEGWSSARIRAYQMIDENPNSYYYRFNAPGEEQRKGQWAPHERELFFKRLEEVGANGQWGIFAMKIPGRVGYQCSNFYRLLIETNEVQDPNYVLDEKGKAHYLFDKKGADGSTEKTFRTHSKHGTGRGSGIASSSSTTKTTRRTASASTTTTTTAAAAAAAKKSKTRKRKTRGWNSDEDDDDDEDDFEDYNDNSGTYTLSTRTTRRTRARVEPENNDTNNMNEQVNSNEEEYEMEESEEDLNLDNPLPGFVDPITLEEVVKPAISTYGHVMGYDSWVRCLTNWEGKKNICPLTKKPLTKRDLVILTHENIEEYRDKIIQ